MSFFSSLFFFPRYRVAARSKKKKKKKLRLAIKCVPHVLNSLNTSFSGVTSRMYCTPLAPPPAPPAQPCSAMIALTSTSSSGSTRIRSFV